MLFSEISMLSYGVYAKGRAIVLLSIETCLLDFLSSTPSFPQFVKYWCGEFMEGVISFYKVLTILKCLLCILISSFLYLCVVLK